MSEEDDLSSVDLLMDDLERTAESLAQTPLPALGGAREIPSGVGGVRARRRDPRQRIPGAGRKVRSGTPASVCRSKASDVLAKAQANLDAHLIALLTTGSPSKHRRNMQIWHMRAMLALRRGLVAQRAEIPGDVSVCEFLITQAQEAEHFCASLLAGGAEALHMLVRHSREQLRFLRFLSGVPVAPAGAESIEGTQKSSQGVNEESDALQAMAAEAHRIDLGVGALLTQDVSEAKTATPPSVDVLDAWEDAGLSLFRRIDEALETLAPRSHAFNLLGSIDYES